MKVAVTGASGMLGTALQKVFQDVETVPLSKADLDVTNLNSVSSVIKYVRPDYLVHAAAFTQVDLCEEERDKALLVNGVGARNVSMVCDSLNIPVVYISTDYVFDGSKNSPYDELDVPAPINCYGESKLSGERFVKEMTNRFYIVRTSWLYGPSGNNFVHTIQRLFSERETVDVVNDQFGSPTYTVDLAKGIKSLLGKGYGTYHMTNAGACSWFDFACEIANLQGTACKVIPVSSDEFRRPARRPRYSVLDNLMMRLEGLSTLRSWRDALGEYLSGRQSS